jgi:hypothetical protein
MNIKPLPLFSTTPAFLASVAFGLSTASMHGQDAGAPAFNDHQNMMDQLHITALRPGKNGNNQTGPGFDLATANPWKDSMPDPLTMKDGTKVTRADQWPARRAEILEDFEREVYGRIPANVPKVTWTVTSTSQGNTGGIPTVTKFLTGHVDNSGYPQINVNISASYTVPANATGPVPVIFEFGGVGGGGGAPRGAGAAGGGAGLPAIANLKSSLTLSDAQVAQITPLLEDFTQMQAAVAKATTDLAAQRTKATADITAVLTTAQKRQFASLATGAPQTLAGGPALPTLAALQADTNLALTDAQAAAIKPILDEVAKAQSDLTDVSDENTALRASSIAKLNDIMSKPQQAQLASLTSPRGRGAAAPGGSIQEAISKGWGYGAIDPGSIQADGPPRAGAPMQGIIGLTNKGEPRTPDQWGELRAWQWGFSRLIDYFEANPGEMVDATKIGVTGVSRYGKAAIVAEAFEPRVAVALVGSSGEGGAKLHRHDFGESVENLTDNSEYGWMAGNFLKYGEATPVARTAADLPVDSHELIALCAPRPVFISYGVESAGDPKWVDAPGSYMAGILAGPVYRLLGKKDFGVTDDYISAPMPPVGQLVGGELAWRQHEGGHTQVPNFPAFYDWIGNYIKAPPLPKG